MGESRISGLEELLRTRVPNVRLGIHGRPRNPVVPTGVAPLDALLGGGLAGGDLTELVGDGPVSGSAQVLHAFLRSLARAGRFMALIDGADSLDIDAEEPAVLSRLLWVRCRTAAEALKAADLVLRDRNLPVVVIDLKLNPVAQLRRISGSVWHRFSRLAEHQGSTVLVITPLALVGGAAARVSVSLARPSGAIEATVGPEAALNGLRFALLRQESNASEPGAAGRVA